VPALLVFVLLPACQASAPADPIPAPSPTRSQSSTPSPPTDLAAAFIQDLSQDGSPERTQPALQAIELAFAAASPDTPVDVVTFDTDGDAAAAVGVAREIAGDPRYVAAFAAPGLGDQAEVVAVLGPAGVPLLSLSARGTVEASQAGKWLRFVAPLDAQARALADAVSTLRASRRGVCLVSAPPDGTTYAREVRRLLPEEADVVDIDDLAVAACGVAVWTGGPEGGAELASTVGADPVVVGGPGLREPRFLDLAGSASDGTTSFCSCADVSTSLALEAQRFIQDYQSEFGSAPGPYAVEAWDAARLLIRVLAAGAVVREDVVAGLATATVVQGLAGPYVFRDGELDDPESAVRRYVLEGGRWVEVARSNDAAG
jgi:branched-chain amino acid transport system substrate-binding protein